jgi:apoptosis-inducing factor 3
VRSMGRVQPQTLLRNNPRAFKVGLATLGLSLSAWMTTYKVFSDEFLIFETEDNLQEGEVRELQVGPKPEDTILVINYQGEIYSTQSKCAHFGFNLAKGLLVGDKLICPLHSAAFSIKTGQEDQGPVFNGIRTFKVERIDGNIRVLVPKGSWESPPEYKELGKENIEKDKKIVIIGAGSAGLSAAETLRKTGYKGYIYLVTKESDSPYDRTMLSKYLDGKKPPGSIRSDEALDNNGIVVVKESTVTGIDYQGKQVEIEGREPLAYDKLLIASGMRNKIPPIEGLKNVSFYSLRNKKDYI